MKKITVLMTALAMLAAAAAMTACGDGESSSSAQGNEVYKTQPTATTTEATVPRVDGMTYVFDDCVGTYYGEVNGSDIPNGEGTWVYNNYGTDMFYVGNWTDGNFITGNIEMVINEQSLGKIQVIDGVPNENDMSMVVANLQALENQAEWDSAVEDIKKAGGYVSDFVNWLNSFE